MASIERKTRAGKVTWQARFRDPDGHSRRKTFAKRSDAERYLTSVSHDVLTGSYLDPKAGRITFESYYAAWSQRQVWEDTTHKAMSLAVRSTPFAGLDLDRIKSSHIEQWIKLMSTTLAASTIKTRFVNVRSVLRAAARDRLIATDPTEGARLPRQRKRGAAMQIPSPEQVGAILEAADERFRPFLAVRVRRSSAG